MSYLPVVFTADHHYFFVVILHFVSFHCLLACLSHLSAAVLKPLDKWDASWQVRCDAPRSTGLFPWGKTVRLMGWNLPQLQICIANLDQTATYGWMLTLYRNSTTLYPMLPSLTAPHATLGLLLRNSTLSRCWPVPSGLSRSCSRRIMLAYTATCWLSNKNSSGLLHQVF